MIGQAEVDTAGPLGMAGWICRNPSSVVLIKEEALPCIKAPQAFYVAMGNERFVSPSMEPGVGSPLCGAQVRHSDLLKEMGTKDRRRRMRLGRLPKIGMPEGRAPRRCRFKDRIVEVG